MWLNNYKKDTVSENTFINYKYAVNLIKSNFEDKNLSSFSELDATKILKELYSLNFSKSTLRIVKITLSQAFKKAIKLGYLSLNPIDDVKIPIAATEKSVNALTIEQQQDIENAALSDKLGDIIIFLMETGLRRQELMNLKWTDYNRKSKTKTGIREIPLFAKAWIIISRQRKCCEYIFTSRGNPLK